jgi:hypothetical protein
MHHGPQQLGGGRCRSRPATWPLLTWGVHLWCCWGGATIPTASEGRGRDALWRLLLLLLRCCCCGLQHRGQQCLVEKMRHPNALGPFHTCTHAQSTQVEQQPPQERGGRGVEQVAKHTRQARHPGCRWASSGIHERKHDAAQPPRCAPLAPHSALRHGQGLGREGEASSFWGGRAVEQGGPPVVVHD